MNIVVRKLKYATVLFCLTFLFPNGIIHSQNSTGGAVLIGFNSSGDLQKLVADNSVSVSLTDQYVAEGDSALDLNFSQFNGLPGVSIYIDSLDNPIQDWSDYGIFSFYITKVSNIKVELGLWIQDQNNSVYYEFLELSAGKLNHIKIKMSRLKTKLDVSKILLVRFFMAQPQQPVNYVIDKIGLTPFDMNLQIIKPMFNNAFYESYSNTALKTKLSLSPKPSGYNAVGRLLSKNSSLIDSIIINPLLDSNIVEFPYELIVPGDTAKLEVDVYSNEGVYVDNISNEIIKYPAKNNEVIIRDDGVTLVNGKPFFPIGIFQSPQEELSEIKNFGFNTAQSYIFTWDSYMQKAEDLGLMVLSTIPAGIFHNEASFNSVNYKYYVNVIKDYSSLLGYYYFDEPNPQSISWDLIKLVDDFSEKVDPYHPTTGVNNNDQDFYAGSSDIMMIDAYPINYPSQGFQWIIDRLELGISSMKGKGPVWFVPQAFPWQPYFWHGDFQNGKYNASLSRPPTYRELRAETWLGINMGVQGIVYYSYVIQNLRIKDAYPVMWKALKYVVNEMKSLQDVLTSDESSPYFQSNSSDVYILSKSYEGEQYFFAVNAASSDIEVEFNIPGNISALNVISEGRNINVSGGNFSDTLSALSTHLYTTSPLYDILPTHEQIYAALKETPSHFNSTDIINVSKDAKITSSWKFPNDSYLPWYRMIDANEYTPWVLTHTEKDAWIEVKLPKAESIRTITLVSKELKCDFQVYNNGQWQTVPITEVASAGYLHFSYTGNYQTAIFPEVITDRIRIVMKDGNTGGKPIFEIEAFSTEEHPTEVDSGEEKTIPQKFGLFQNYPNPFNNGTTISYNLPESGQVDLSVYDIIGKQIVKLIDQYQSAGHYQVYFDAKGLSSGVYFYRITAGKFTDQKKIILLK